MSLLQRTVSMQSFIILSLITDRPHILHIQERQLANMATKVLTSTEICCIILSAKAQSRNALRLFV